MSLLAISYMSGQIGFYQSTYAFPLSKEDTQSIIREVYKIGAEQFRTKHAALCSDPVRMKQFLLLSEGFFINVVSPELRNDKTFLIDIFGSYNPGLPVTSYNRLDSKLHDDEDIVKLIKDIGYASDRLSKCKRFALEMIQQFGALQYGRMSRTLKSDPELKAAKKAAYMLKRRSV